MTPANRQRRSVFFRSSVWAALVLGAFAASSVWSQTATAAPAQTDESGGAPENSSFYLSLDFEQDGNAEILFYFDESLEKQHNFPAALSATLGCTLEDVHFSTDVRGETRSLHGQCDIPVHRWLLTHSGTIDLEPIKEIWELEPGRTFLISLTNSRRDFLRCDPAPDHFTQTGSEAHCVYLMADPAHAPAELHFAFGYKRSRFLVASTILGLLLSTPIALSFWFRRRALLAPEDAKPAVSFAYRRFLTWTALLGSLIWWTGVDLLRFDELVKFLIPFEKVGDAIAADVLPWILLWMFPAAVYFLCLSLSSPMQKLRGTQQTQGQILNQSFWSVARFFLPLSLTILGITELFHSPRAGVLLIAASFLVGRLANQKAGQAHGMELHALTSGELRDRAFAIAQKANTKLNQIYVLPTERMRVANAFAHVAQNILLTDYLLKNLSKSEVDAVIGHEMAHLQKKHVGRRMTVLFVAIGVSGFVTAFLENRLAGSLPTGPILYAIMLLVVFFNSRRNEFAADAGSVRLNGDPAAMITALARLTRLNTVPMEWNKLDEKLLTHPSTLRRIRRLAADANISEAGTAELLRQSLAPPTETYAVPATALPAGKVFSTQYKSRLAWNSSWVLMLTTALLPAVVASLARLAGLAGGGLWLVYLLGFLLTMAMDVALLNFLPFRGFAKLEQLLREKYRAEGNVKTGSAGLLVSLAPDSVPRVYEGNWAWDLGFLTLSNGRIAYWGEEARFALRREEITSLSIGPGPAGWFETPSVYISWRDAAGRAGVFNMRPVRARSMRDMAAKTRVLSQQLEKWHRGLPVSDDALAPMSAPSEKDGDAVVSPAFGQVTGIGPRALVRRQLVVRDLVLNSFLAIGVAIVFGLGFSSLDELFGSPDSGDLSTTLNSAAGGFYVLVVVWLGRVLVLLPFLRAREHSSSS